MVFEGLEVLVVQHKLQLLDKRKIRIDEHRHEQVHNHCHANKVEVEKEDCPRPAAAVTEVNLVPASRWREASGTQSARWVFDRRIGNERSHVGFGSDPKKEQERACHIIHIRHRRNADAIFEP